MLKKDGTEAGSKTPAAGQDAPEHDSRRVDPRFLSLPYILPATVIVGAGVGIGLDSWQNSWPVWFLICLLAFVIVGFYLVIREALR